MADYFCKITESLSLEMLKLKHVDEFYQVVLENKEKLIQYVPSIEYVSNKNDIEGMIRYSTSSFETNKKCLLLGIIYDGHIIGCISCEFEKEHFRCELGYWIIPEYQGRGLMYESVSYLCKSLFTEFYVNKIVIFIIFGNERSHKLADRLGFVQEGFLKQHVFVSQKSHDVTTLALFNQSK
jgi:ribosomal-protein-serine acetyltransferase